MKIKLKCRQCGHVREFAPGETISSSDRDDISVLANTDNGALNIAIELSPPFTAREEILLTYIESMKNV